MGDLRLYDQAGLCRLASLLDEAAADIRLVGRVASMVLEGVAVVDAVARSLLPTVTGLERSAGALRRRRLAPDRSHSAAVTQIDPRPVPLAGVAGASERWGSTTAGSREWLRDSALSAGWGGQVSARRADVAGPLGEFSASALAAEAQVEAWVGFDDWGLELAGVAEVGLQLAQVEYGLDTRYVDVASEAFVGGEAALSGDLDLNLDDSDVGFAGGIDAFIGMAAAAEVGLGSDTARVVGGGEVGIGLGVDVDAAATFTGGVFNFDLGASAFLGVGGGFDFALEVDLGAIGSGTVDVIEGATNWITSLWP